MASEVDVEDDSESNILYDLTIQADWPQEAEIFNRGHQREKSKSNVSLIGRLTSGTQRAIWTFLRTLGIPIQTASPCFLPVDLVKLINSQINWHIEVGSEGKVVAILQDQCVEIRSKRDNYDSIIGRGSVPPDPYPQWRHLAWSPDNTMLACSQSNGTVDVFDLVGTQLFSIKDDTPRDANAPLDLSCAVAGLIFTDHKPGEKWSSELLVVNFHGSLRSYSVDRDNGYELNHSFVFNQQYPRGIGSVVYHPQTKLLLVGGICSYGNQVATKSVQEGLTAWRNLSGYPHYKLVTDYEQDSPKNQHKGLMKRLTSINLLYRGNEVQDGIFNMCLSPDKKLLATLHHSGKLSVWQVPSLKLCHTWNQEDQPGFDEISPEFTENPQRNKTLRDLVTCKNLLDVNWWNKQTIILARSTGAITLSSVKTLKNLLGNSPEWFEPAPRVTPVYDGGFLGLEVESKFPMKRRLVGSEDDEYEDSDDEDVSLVTKAARFSKNVLYYVTDNERFQPPRKKPKIVNRTYRLICLKSTTPEELYTRKIDNEEYGEALVLAKAYNLDSDLVYQRQWKKSIVSMASIQDYLSKINKRSWVLHECLERIPENIDATKELLEFGLRGTDLQALVAIGNGDDGGRFILCDLEEGLYEDMSFDDFNPEDQRRKEEMRKERQEQLLSQVDFSSLTLEQRELCRVRLKLLQYLYRLKTYECILGGESAAAERFNHKFFKKFRSQNIVEAAVEYARNSDWKALETLMTFHGEDLSEHRLSILSNFSETTCPSEYRYLLPEVNDEGIVIDWNEDEWREKDWSEFDNCRLVVEPTQIDLGASLYEENPELQKFRAKKLTKELLSEWYMYQAFEIERCSRLVDSALELIKLGMERGVQGLNDMLDDLVTMEMLVYECNIEDTLTFDELRQMADYDKLELIMSKSTEEMYTKNLHRWLVPFLLQCERRNPGSSRTLLRDYTITLAKSDFTLCLKIFESSKTTLQNPLIKDQEELLSIALESLYACERDDQLSLAVKIVQCLPEKTKGKQSSELVKLHKDVDRLERHIRAAKILDEHGARKPLYFIKDSENGAEDAKNLIIKLTRTAGRRGKPLSVSEWMKLYEDVLILQDQVYRCISAGLCQEIFTESLLCSERKENIILAGELIERKATESEPLSHTPSFHKNKVHYDRSVHLVLSAAQEYFNSSANLMDPCMDLARTCLNLILDTPTVIQEELDLIASLALLDDFGVMILPLQVRLSKDRLELVRMAVRNKPNSFRQSKKILRLAHLLRVEGVNRSLREGQTLHLIADAAVENCDYSFGYEICKQLMDDGYGPAWNVCVDLASKEDFSDINAKAELLEFSVTYCVPDMIEPILQAKALLERQILCGSMTADNDEDVPDDAEVNDNSQFTASNALRQTQQILSSTSNKTKAVLSTMTDTKWWQGTLKALKQPLLKRSLSDQPTMMDHNERFEKQGSHPFYESVIDNCYTDISAVDYVRGEMLEDPETSMSEQILRAARLEEMLTEGEQSQPVDEVLLQLSISKLPVDSTLGLAYLLSLPKALEAEKCFENFPNTYITLQLAVYYYSLQIYTSVKPVIEDEPCTLYKHDPLKVIQKVINFVNNKKDYDWPAEVLELVTKLKQYYEALEDFSQAKMLQKLGRGIDVIRFTEDSDYKMETILGLAMTLDEKVYGMAVSLADRYDIDLWEIYMTHLEFIFSESGLTTEEMEERVNKMKILPTLVKSAQEFSARMHKFVFPTIEGTDHSRLTYYYTLLSGSDIEIPGGISADSHVKLLRKIKSAVQGLDYKKLMDGDHNPVNIIVPVLNSNNIGVIAKLANKIPDGKGKTLHSSVVYCAWAIKLFWDVDSKKTPDSSAGWVHRYEACGETLQKLLPEDIINFVNGVVFVQDSREKLQVDCRKEIIRRSLKSAKQQGGKKKKQDDTGSKISWEEVAAILQRYLNHIDVLQNEIILSMEQAEDLKIKNYARRYDLSRGDEKELQDLLVDMVLDGQNVEMVEDVMSVSQVASWTPRTAIQGGLHRLVNLLGNNGPKDKKYDNDPLTMLEQLVENVQEHMENGGELVSAEDVMALLRPFCSDSSMPVKPRLDVLHILEKNFKLSEEDLLLLTLYRTEAVVKDAWDGIELKEEDIKSDHSRHRLFETLLSQSSSETQYMSVCSLLKLWPPLTAVQKSTVDDNPWVQVFDGMICSGDKNCINKVYPEYKQAKEACHFSKEGVEFLFKKLLDVKSPIEGIKLVLLSNIRDLYPGVIQELTEMSQVSFDEELCVLILQQEVIADIVHTMYYQIVTDYLIEKQDPDIDLPGYLSVHRVANQLQEKGFIAESGSLLLQTRASHPLLQTFGAAFSVVGSWLKR